MRFSTAFFLLPALLATTASAGKAKAILADLAKLTTDLSAVNATVNTFKPNQLFGVATALKIESQTNTLGDALNKAISDATASKDIGSKQSTAIATAVLNLIAPINSTLNNIIAHKASFQSGFLIIGDLSKTVESILQSEQNLTATLGAELGPKLSAPFNSLAPQISAQLVALFDPALAAFKMCGTGLCLPPIIL